jgi:hypothetical protein
MLRFEDPSVLENFVQNLAEAKDERRQLSISLTL